MEYYINCSSEASRILNFDAYDNRDMKEYNKSFEDIMVGKEDKCIKYLQTVNKYRETPKFIYIGERINASSIKIRETFYQKLKQLNLVGRI